MILLKMQLIGSDESSYGSRCIIVSEKLRYGRSFGRVVERNISVKGGTGTANPGKGMVTFGTAKGADMCSRSFRVRADGTTSIDVVVDADFFAVRGTEFTVCDFRPGRFSIGKFCRFILVMIVLSDWMAFFTTKDAADRVRLSAARWK